MIAAVRAKMGGMPPLRHFRIRALRDWGLCRNAQHDNPVREQRRNAAPMPAFEGRVFMFRILQIDHIVLRVTDGEAMVRFYCDALGCAVERRKDDIGLIQLRAGAQLIDIVPVDSVLGREGGAAPGREGRNLDHFCLRIEPFEPDTVRAHLAKFGIEAGPVKTRDGAEGAGPSIYFDDPEGNRIELKGPSTP
jgi:catechol 2,3-dioxygenase-like lactoylglutathione lyase family enzyme